MQCFYFFHFQSYGEVYGYIFGYRNRRLYAGGNLSAALNSSRRIQRRVDEVIRKRDYSLESDEDSDYSLDVLRESLREERNALNDAIKEADRE